MITVLQPLPSSDEDNLWKKRGLPIKKVEGSSKLNWPIDRITRPPDATNQLSSRTQHPIGLYIFI